MKKPFRLFDGHRLALHKTITGRNARAKALEIAKDYRKAHLCRMVKRSNTHYELWTTHYITK